MAVLSEEQFVKFSLTDENIDPLRFQIVGMDFDQIVAGFHFILATHNKNFFGRARMVQS